TVFDAAGNSHSDDLFVTVVDTITPIADAGENQTENQGTRIFFNATLSSDNIGIVDYKWSFKEGRYDRYLSGVTSSYTFDIPGKYIVTLKVTDKAGNAAKDNVTIDIVDTVPPRAFFKAKETWVNEGEPMIFDARNSWDNVAVTDWTWTIDSTELTGEKVSYTFDEAAFYSITLNVTDAAGNFDVLTYQYRVYGILGNDNGGGGTSIIGNASTQETDFSGCMIIVVALVVVLSIAAVVILLVLKKRTKMQGEILMAQPGDIALGTSTVNKLRAGTPTIDTQLFPMNPNPENIHQNGGFVFERNVMEQIKVDETKPIHDNSFFNETTEKEIPSSIRNMIPNYTLTHILRTGDFATVYRGKDSQGHDVAIKLPKLLDATLDSTIYDKFESETKIWKNLKHKNIVNLYGNGLDPIPYIVMELMQGGDLKQLMDHHRLGIKESVDIMQQILDGVSYAHRMASVHSDIKPENILFNAEGIAKISDWGVGKFMLSPSVTKTGEIEGNLQYLAPEHIHKSKFGAVDWISDIFQLGILFYEMLTGENPFFDDDPVGIMEKITDEETKPPSELNPDISKDLDSIILKALQKRKEDRWRSTDIMFDRLRRVAVKGLIESRPR
ncbi:MAG: protein kinase, partial [Candidatus Thermoplasmatota archaeon]|nr:protein kinase [Candidatus Thermoplasmatota archaeon]